MIIKPTVGRQVWYWPFGHNRTLLGVFDDKQPCAATVTYVWSERMVNLRALSPAHSDAVNFTSVQLVQEGDVTPENIQHGGYATWMPYQVGQARAQAETPPLESGNSTPRPDAANTTTIAGASASIIDSE